MSVFKPENWSFLQGSTFSKARLLYCSGMSLDTMFPNTEQTHEHVALVSVLPV